MALDPRVLFGLVAGLGSGVRAIWAFAKLRHDKPKLAWDWFEVLQEVGPAFVLGFLAGFAVEEEASAVQLVSLFLAGAGLSSLQTKAGWKA